MIKSNHWIGEKLFYGWVVVIAFLVIHMIAFGTRLSFGVFFKALAGEFGSTRAQTSGVFSAHMLLCGVCAFLSGWAVDRFSPRILTGIMGLFTGLSFVLTSQVSSLWQLFIVYSLLMSIGTGGLYGVGMATIIRWFQKSRGTAIGVATSGGGLGTLMIAPLAAYLIASFGWRTSSMIIGVIAWLLVIPMAWLLRREPGEMGLLPYGARSDGAEASHSKQSGSDPTVHSLWQAVRTRNFWCIGLSWLMFSLCSFMIFAHIVAHGTDIGIPAMEAATILSLIGVMNIPGRLLVGRISDSVSRKATAITCALFMAGAILWLICSKDLWMFYVFAAVFGFFFGGFDASTSAMIGDLFGLRGIGLIMGALTAGFGLGAAIGPLIGGLVYDLTDNYSVAFSICAAAMVSVTFLLVFIKRGND
jgi:MFS transporter, OFA family, oxalate/formate antiporter